MRWVKVNQWNLHKKKLVIIDKHMNDINKWFGVDEIITQTQNHNQNDNEFGIYQDTETIKREDNHYED